MHPHRGYFPRPGSFDPNMRPPGPGPYQLPPPHPGFGGPNYYRGQGRRESDHSRFSDVISYGPGPGPNQQSTPLQRGRYPYRSQSAYSHRGTGDHRGRRVGTNTDINFVNEQDMSNTFKMMEGRSDGDISKMCTTFLREVSFHLSEEEIKKCIDKAGSEKVDQHRKDKAEGEDPPRTRIAQPDDASTAGKESTGPGVKQRPIHGQDTADNSEDDSVQRIPGPAESHGGLAAANPLVDDRHQGREKTLAALEKQTREEAIVRDQQRQEGMEMGKDLYKKIIGHEITKEQAIPAIQDLYKAMFNGRNCGTRVASEQYDAILEEGDKVNANEVVHETAMNRILGPMSELVFDNKEEVTVAARRRMQEMERQGSAVLPKALEGMDISAFDGVEGYTVFVRDVMKTLVANIPIIEERTKAGKAGADLGDWSVTQQQEYFGDTRQFTHTVEKQPEYDTKASNYNNGEQSEFLRRLHQSVHPGDANYQSNQTGVRRSGNSVPGPNTGHRDREPTSDEGTGTRDRRVGFSSSTQNQDGGTFTLHTHGGRQQTGRSPSDRGEGYNSGSARHSTPYRGGNGYADVSHIDHPETPGIGNVEEATYNTYQIPYKYRRRENTGAPLLSSTLGDTHPTQPNTPVMQSVMSVVPAGHIMDMFTQFDGTQSSFMEWKSMTEMLLAQIPADLRPILLKFRLLKSNERGMIAHIKHTDPTATEDIWEALGRHFGCDIEQADYHLDKLQRWIRDGAQCSDYKSLLHLYNLVKEHYYGIVRLGADKVGMAEAVGYGITPLLYGRSQKEVNRLRFSKQSFNMGKVLRIIENHLDDEKRKERDRDKLHSNDPEVLLRDYTERDIPFLRKGLGQTNWQDKGKYWKDQYKKADHQHIGKESYKGKDNYNNYKHKDETYSPSKYSYNNYKHRDGSYSPSKYSYRSNSKERESEKAHVNAAQTNTNSSTNDYKPTKERQSRDQTPGPHYRRGSLSRSPVRSDKDRPLNSYRCPFCIQDDHDVFTCRKHTPQELYGICNSKRLCYVCFLTGHSSNSCRSGYSCTHEKCNTDFKHNKMLCDKFREK